MTTQWTRAERRILERARVAQGVINEHYSRQRNFVPHEPTAKQREFLSLTCMEALYGGAAGGGKTDALLMASAQHLHVPGYSALLLRRTYPDLALPGAIMDRAKTWWISQGVFWHDKDKRFTFPSGASVTFGYLDTESDRFRYQGAEFQFIGFDELTQFPEGWYRYLLSRLRRREGMNVPLYVRSASNPGGIGHDWVRRRFVESADPQRMFVPAFMADNPHLDQEQYGRSLAQLDPTTRKQLAEGVWVRDGAGLVYAHFDDGLSLVTQVPDNLTYYICGLDFGIEDENAVTVLGWREHDPCVYVVESYRIKADVRVMSEEVKRLEDRFRFVKIVGDEGGMGKAFAEDMRAYHTIPVQPADKHNKHGYIALLNAEMARGRIKVVESACQDLISEWRELPWNDKRTKEADGFDNHASDACLYAWRACTNYHESPAAMKPRSGSVEHYKAMEDELERLATEPAEDQQWPW